MQQGSNATLTFQMLLEERRQSGRELIIAKWKLRSERQEGVTEQSWTDWLKKNFPCGHPYASRCMLVAKHWDRIQKAVDDGTIKNFTDLAEFLKNLRQQPK